jgi:hypothetical protein
MAGKTTRVSGQRGQTEFDYLVGMTLLLLTLTGVFLFVPSILQSFEDPVDGDDQASAKKVADDLLTRHTTAGASNTVIYASLNRSLNNGTRTIGRHSVNVSLTNDTGTITAGGPSLADADDGTATVVRVVRLADDPNGRCEPACRLVVRAW